MIKLLIDECDDDPKALALAWVLKYNFVYNFNITKFEKYTIHIMLVEI